MKILFLPKYTALGASSRMRTYQYLQYYRDAGIECTVEPFFDDSYLKNLYEGKRDTLKVIYFYFKRLFIILTFFQYDKIFLEKEVFPYSPAISVFLLVIFREKYIVDYDDAIFHNYDRNTNFFIRTILGKKIDTVMKYADVVIAGNSYLAKRALEAGAKNIKIIPTVVDLARYPTPDFKSNTQFSPDNDNHQMIIGWIGTKSTFEKHLLLIKDWLIKAQEIFDVKVQIIGITHTDRFIGNNVHLTPWSEHSEVAHIKNFDIGIMPLQNTSWEEGKCAYKIIQYLACGKPVIASNVGMNSQLCINGETGFLADTEEEFLQALHTLLNDKELRIEMGKNGRALVEQNYNLEITSSELVKILLA